MPDIGAEESTTAATDNLCSEDGFGGMLSLFLAPLLKFLLGHVILFRSNDCLMTVLYKELPNLPIIHFALGKEVLLEGLLQDDIATVLLIPEDPYDGLTIPLCPSSPCLHSSLSISSLEIAYGVLPSRNLEKMNRTVSACSLLTTNYSNSVCL